MNYLSVCSGIEAATVAWHHMGWKPVGFSEIEKFPSQVLAHHYPQVTNFGDMTKYKEWNINDSVGLLVGGTPCQSFSVAGLRKGLEDPRGNLALTYVGILDKFRPKWCVWENVPGVLSSGSGRDFGSFLGALAQLGYGFSYRVLDAQNFGVAQRRRRVFVVGHLGDWKPSAKVLFESESLSGNIKQGRKAQQKTTGITTSRLVAFGEYSEDGTASTIKARDYKDATDLIVIDRASFNQGINALYEPKIEFSETMPTLCNDYSRADGFNMIAYSYDDHREGLRINEEITNTLCAAAGTGGGNVPLTMAIQGNLIGRDKGGQNGVGVSDSNTMYTLTKTDVHAVATNMAVRRLTEVECERLQGFPDNYTNIKESCPSGARYKALGNSMAVPVMRWIGERIEQVERGMA